MKLEFQVTQYVPYGLTVTLLNIPRYSQMRALQMVTESMGLSFSPILGDYYCGNDPKAPELFRGKVIFPLELDASFNKEIQLKYWNWKQMMLSVFPYLMPNFLNGELKCLYSQRYMEVISKIEKQQSYGNHSIFYNPCYVAELKSLSVTLREALSTLYSEQTEDESLTSAPNHSLNPA